MSLTVTSIITVGTLLTFVYLAMAQADDSIPVKNEAASRSGKPEVTPTRGKRAALLAPHRQKREMSGQGITIPGKGLGETHGCTRFLDAPSHLYMRLCPSVRRSVRPSVRPSVRRSVGPSRVIFEQRKSTLPRF